MLVVVIKIYLDIILHFDKVPIEKRNKINKLVTEKTIAKLLLAIDLPE